MVYLPVVPALTHTHSKLFKQRSFYTQQVFTHKIFYTQQAFTHSKRLHTEHLHTVLLHMASVYTHRNFYTETLLDAQRSLYTQELQLQNRISTPKRKKDDFEALFKRKIPSAKMEKICWQITVAAFMQPLQYDLRSPAAKDNSITHAAAARSNLDAAITMRSAKTELQNTIKVIELRSTASEIAAPKPDLDAKAKKRRRFWSTFEKDL